MAAGCKLLSREGQRGKGDTETYDPLTTKSPGHKAMMEMKDEIVDGF